VVYKPLILVTTIGWGKKFGWEIDKFLDKEVRGGEVYLWPLSI
jgi:hypothetical protein